LAGLTVAIALNTDFPAMPRRVCGAEPSEAAASPARQTVTAKRVLVIAHRGDSSNAPENTLAAFLAGVQTGADLIELDYHHSADGVPVVIHDKELDRTTNVGRVLGREKVPVHSLALAELRKLDAGRWFSFAYAGARIPTLEEALDAIQVVSTTLVERKAGDAQTCVKLLQKKKLVEDVIVQSFDWEFLRECHRLEPALTLTALGDDPITPQRLDEIRTTGAAAVGWSEKHLRPQDIQEIHRRGLKVWVYTVDDDVRAREFLLGGVDGIITNQPRKMLSLIRENR
jgi:glycerophosphoryl diester phosphodiesterase